MMEHENREEALRIINDTQTGTSSVTVRIGGTSDTGQVEHDTLYIERAPTRVIEALQAADFTVSMTDDGLRVDDHKLLGD